MTIQLNVETIRHCSLASFQSDMPFPEVILRLYEAGVERYHTDLVLQAKTYYSASGEAHTVAFPTFAGVPVPETFSEPHVKEAIRAIQQREIGYREFLSRIMDAGTAAYDVYIAGGRTVYIGRRGDFCVEPFPPPEHA